MKRGKRIIIHHTLLISAFFVAMLVAPLSFAGEQKTGILPADQVLVELSSQKPAKTDRKRNGKLRTKFA